MPTEIIWTHDWREITPGRFRFSLLRNGEVLVSAEGADMSLAVQNALEAVKAKADLNADDLDTLRRSFLQQTGGTPPHLNELPFVPLLTQEQQQELIDWLTSEFSADTDAGDADAEEPTA